MLLKLVEDVERAIEHECYFAALALALTLPDICRKAAYPTEEKNWKRYKDWCQEFVSENIPRDDPYAGDMPFMNEDILCSLRCSLLHQGNPSIEKGEDDRKYWDERCKVDHFILQITDYGSVEGISANVAYKTKCEVCHREIKLSIREICHRICLAAKNYFENNKDKFTFFDFDVEDCRKESDPFYRLEEDS